MEPYNEGLKTEEFIESLDHAVSWEDIYEVYRKIYMGKKDTFKHFRVEKGKNNYDERR